MCWGKNVKIIHNMSESCSSERTQPLIPSIGFFEIFRLATFQGFQGKKSRRKRFKKNHKTIGK